MQRTTRALTTPDGSRFVLVQDPQLRQTHWALASWIDGRDDPPNLAGLTLATLRASRNGTWSTGSEDPAAEQAALAALDLAWQDRMTDPGNAVYGRTLVQRDRAAAALCDPRAFGRVLAALPAHRPEIVERGGVAVFALTTVAPALPQLARMLFERREQQALRGLARSWLPNVMQRAEDYRAHPERRVQAELLALTTPMSPTIALLEPPPIAAPRRAQALAAWAASQHPTRTVHLLYGGFDPDAVAAMLKLVFAETQLPTPAQPMTRAPRRLAAQRRSVIPGLPADSVSLAWVLPPGVDRWDVEVATRWLTEGAFARLKQLLRQERPKLELTAAAPWPGGAHPGLLRLDARDPGGADGLAGDLVEACRTAAEEELPDGRYYRANMEAISAWFAATTDSRELAVLLAARALAQPDAQLSPDPPKPVQGAAVRAALRATFRGEPAIVEGR
ncbi:MAG: hypothetical protein ACON4Z_13750 [Planctomycetota bacterium]